MTVAAVAAGVLAGGGLYLWSFRPLVGFRLRRLGGASSTPHIVGQTRSNPSRLTNVPRPLMIALPAAAAFSVSGSLTFAAVAAGMGWLWHRRSRRTFLRQRRVLAAAVAPCADLLAACLAAGASPADAITTVAEVNEGPLREHLSRVAVALSAGADVAQAWAVANEADSLAPLARAFARSTRSGAPLASTVAAVADDLRRARRWEAEASARRAGVLAVAPLAMCFLPAFVLVGVVPAVAGIATQLLVDF